MTEKLKILLVDSLHPVFKLMTEEKGFVCVDGTEWTTGEIKDRINEFSGITLRSRMKIDKEIISDAKSLKFIARAGAGMENIDVNFAQANNITCLNSPEGNRDAVGEHALGMLLVLMNNLKKADHEVRQGIWKREENRGTELMGKTAGIIGFGNTGSAFAKKLSGFGVQIIAYDKYVPVDTTKFPFVLKCTPEKIFDEADILSLHIPLTEETTYMVNDEFINKFKKSFYLVNTSRGKIVKTDDLVKHLQSGKIKGACLDVFEFEDISFEKMHPEDSGTLNYLKNCDKVILTPHIAGWTHESTEKIARALAEKIINLNLSQK